MKTIFPIIVIYKVQLDEAASFQSIIRPNHFAEYLVYDNSPSSFQQDVSRLPAEAIYLRNTNNGGLSEAYNEGARIAQKKGYKRILLLDQDTLFAENTLNRYLEQIDYPGIVAPAIVTKQGANFSPVDISGWTPKGANNINAGEISLFNYALVNSGCCIPVSLFSQSGGYVPKVNLDFSDFQFQIKVRRHNAKALVMKGEPAIQDFSNDCRELAKILPRYNLYLQCAKHFEADTTLNKLKHQYVVARHTLALLLRTKSLSILKNYLSCYWFGKD